MDMGERIKEMRKLRGYTQEELAKKLGLKDSAIAKYENGRVENIKRSVIAEMAKILDCSPVYLLCLDDNSSPDITLTDEEKQLVLEYRSSDSDSKDMVKRILAYANKMK